MDSSNQSGAVPAVRAAGGASGPARTGWAELADDGPGEAAPRAVGSDEHEPHVAGPGFRDRLEAAWAGARDGLWDWDVVTGVARFSPRWKELLGIHAEVALEPDEWFRRVHPDDVEPLRRDLREHLEGVLPFVERRVRMQHASGSWRHFVCRAAVHCKGRLLAGSISDVTDLERAHERIRLEAWHDPLTGLPNRQLFLDRLGLSLSRSHRRGAQKLAVLFLDLDRFGNVNDSLGPEAGDRLLAEVSRRIAGILRPGDTFARLGNDTFGILLDGVGGPRDAARFADRMAEVLLPPLVIDGHEIFPSASTGIAVSRDGVRAEGLLNDAVTAMHRAKEDGATRYELFDPGMSARAKDRLRLEADLRHAIRRGEFALHYQPIISFSTGRLSSFEALVRWRHPERGFVRPDEFIPIAEETGLILPLGAWVLRQACTQMRAWQEGFPSSAGISMAVNLSGRQFEEPDLVDQVGRVLEEVGLHPESLKLEMTESVIMARTKRNAAKLQSLRDMGVRIMIDDFGTGYSSLASLHSFPLDSLKIDRSFVRSMEFEGEKTEIVRTIVTLARNLGLDVVAEGVETMNQLRMLRALECHHGQGYYFSNAVDGESAAAWLAASPRW